MRVKICVPAGSGPMSAFTCTCTHARALQPSCIAVIDQPRVPADGDAPPRGAEIRFRADRVLLIAQLIADVGQQLDQRDAQIGGITFRHCGISTAMRSSISRRKLA